MTLYDKVYELAKKHDISLADLADELNLSRHAFYKWKTSSPKSETLEAVADYFNVSTDYLLGREEKTSLAEKHGVFAFDGEPVTDEEVEFLKSVLAAKRASDKK